MTTPHTVFSEHVSNFLSAAVLSPLVDWLRTHKNVETSAEELTSVLQIPTTKAYPIIGLPQAGTLPMQMPAVPGMLGGLPALATGAKTTRGKKTTDGPKCQYIYVKGDHEGEACGKGAENSALGPRCKTHLGKTGKAGGDNKPAAQAAGIPPMTGLIGVPVFGQTAAPQMQMQMQMQQPQTRQEIVATRIPGTEYLRETTIGAVLKQLPDDSLIALGIEEAGLIRAPTDFEIQQIQARGIIYQPTTTTVVPQVHTFAAPAAMPAMPTIPTLGQMSALPIMGLPTIPQLGAIPTLT